jgi:Galactose oxidase, central domain/Kelch motif
MKNDRVMGDAFGRTRIGGLAIALSVVAVGMSVRATTPTFTPTGTLHIARAGHQATLLLDGRVLVTGGYDSAGGGIARAEVFSAGTGVWAEAASNIEARTDHAATRLQDGRVLVVGGASSISSCSPTATAALYDPATDTWSLMRDLPIAIGTGMSAVLLGDGRVLVSGGNRCGRLARTAALFNPSTHQWSTTAAMNAPRAFHSAVLLADSRVLVMGGVTADGGILPTAELYNPVSATWTATEGPETPRQISCGAYTQTFLATLQNGSVLGAGGVAGDCLAGAAPTVSVDVFDPNSSRWSPANRPQVARALTTVTALPDGRLLVAGGYAASGRVESSVEFFDPTTGGWSLIGTLRTPRAGHTATRLTNGAVLIAGGTDAVGRTPTAEIYMPAIPYTSGPLCAPRGDSRSSPLADRPWGIATNSTGHVFLALTRASERTRVIEYAPTEVPFPDLLAAHQGNWRGGTRREASSCRMGVSAGAWSSTMRPVDSSPPSDRLGRAPGQ